MSNLPSLYTISGDLLALLNEIENNEGEITPEVEQALAITEEQFAAKSEDYGHAILNLKAMATAAKAEKDRLYKLQKFYENTADRLSTALCKAMDVLDHPSVETPSVRLFLRRTIATEIEDADLVPKDYKTVKVEEVVNKTAVKEAIKSGKEVPGAKLIENISLQIK